jgi:hypothetical protein
MCPSRATALLRLDFRSSAKDVRVSRGDHERSTAFCFATAAVCAAAVRGLQFRSVGRNVLLVAPIGASCMDAPNCIVLGAGLTGLSAARHLTLRGWHVTVVIPRLTYGATIMPGHFHIGS